MTEICERCVMDTSAQGIFFDDSGVCNFCTDHERKVRQTPYFKSEGKGKVNEIFRRIQSEGRGEYDCLIGLSGGVDSSYVAYQAVKHGLKPLAVHFDNGWNSELAVQNIENIVRILDIDLYTCVINWPEFKDIQRSFFKANVIDIEMVTDHAIFASMYQIARKFNIGNILSGTNSATESIMPPEWQHFKFDVMNLKNIHRKFGTLPIKNYPTISALEMAMHHYIGRIKTISPLNYIGYSKKMAVSTLENELSWRNYGGKHYESTFTKFYQSYILPEKFGVDKRKAHLSDLIMNQEISRNEAIEELKKPLYSADEIARDTEYVCKKLGFTKDEFSDYMKQKPRLHAEFGSSANFTRRLVEIHKKVRYR